LRTANDEFQSIKKEVNVVKDKNIKKRKSEHNENVHDDDKDVNDGDDLWMDNSWLQLTSSSKKQYTKESNSNYVSPEPHELSYERLHISSVEDIYETPNEPFETLIKQSLQTR